MKNLLIIINLFLVSVQLLGEGLELDAYIRSWPIGTSPYEQRLGKYWKSRDIKGDCMNKLTVAFANLNRDGSIYIKDAESNEYNMPVGFNKFEIELHKVKVAYPNLKLGLAIGGWGADGFSQMAEEDKKRRRFVESVVEKIERYKLDSIEINWLYPGNGTGGKIRSSERDKKNFTILLEELHKELVKYKKEKGKKIELCIAAGAVYDYIEWVEVEKIVPLVDSVVVLAYDFYGGWSSTTGHISNLYQSKYDTEGMSVDKIVKYFEKNGIPKEKLVMAVPLYGRIWKGVDKVNNGLYRNFKKEVYSGGIGHRKIKELLELGLERHWDKAAGVPYLYNGDIFVSYEDHESLDEKVEYAKAQGLKGIALWEYTYDLDGDLIEGVYRELND